MSQIPLLIRISNQVTLFIKVKGVINMKRSFIPFALAAALCTLTSCGSKADKEQYSSALSADTTTAVTTAANTESAADTTTTAKNSTEAVSVTTSDTGNADYSEYQSIALDLVERYYEMHPNFLFKFNSFINLDDTVTFKLADPFMQREITDVVFARISGKGLELNSMEDIMDYKKTVYSKSFAEKYPMSEPAVISDEYSNGDYIDETNIDNLDLLYYESYIIYKGNLYASTVLPRVGWIGHTAPDEPVIITDVTDKSFRAYYPGYCGTPDMPNSKSCDIVDFIIDPDCGEWRINDILTQNHSVYEEKAAELNS